MAKIITIANQKGGVGKTTTALCMATGLTQMGQKTLVIDTDLQGNLTHAFGADQTDEGIFEGVIQHMGQGDIIPSTQELTRADVKLQEVNNRTRLLKNLLQPIQDNYSYIIIDTPPALGMITANALIACDEVIVPMGCDSFSIQGLMQLNDNITYAKRNNPRLKIAGILLTRYNGRTVLSRDVKKVIEKRADELKTIVFKTVIRDGIAVKEAQIRRQSLFAYAPKSKPAKDYMDFISEYMKWSV